MGPNLRRIDGSVAGDPDASGLTPFFALSGLASGGYWEMVPGTSDIEHLGDFARSHSEPAFDALVRRHLDLVHSAAFRLTQDPHLSEDIAQSVFLALARQAPDVVRRMESGAPLSAWLLLTTRHLAAKAVRTNARRRAREQETHTMSGPLSSDADSQTTAISNWNRLAPHLDEALAALPESDRNAVVWRFFERKTAREIGVLLGIGEEAAQKRVRRALDRLRGIVSRRVPHLSAPALAALVLAHGIQKAPASLAATITPAALGASTGAASVSLPGGLLQLTSDLVMTKSQSLITGAVVAALVLPLGWQRWELMKTRAQLAATPIVGTTSSPASSAPSTLDHPGSVVPDETAERQRLAGRIEDLRAQLATARMKAEAPRPAPPRETDVLLSSGRPVAVTNLAFVGNATLPAAVQSLLTLQKDGDVEGTLSLMLLPPSDVREWWDEVAHDPEKRELLANHLKSEVTNVLAVSLAEIEPISDRRSRVRIERHYADTTNVFDLTLGLGAHGWKRLP